MLKLRQFAALTVVVSGFYAMATVSSQSPTHGSVLKGTVTSSDGKVMQGVTVSLRGEGKTFVTTRPQVRPLTMPV